MPQINHPPYEDMPDIVVHTDGVEKLFRNIDPSKAVGSEGVSNTPSR